MDQLPREENVNLQKTHFTEMFIDANGLDPTNFKNWVFFPGMLFYSPDKWWGDLGRRDFPHEGIDFCFYRNDSGHIVRLDQKTRLPAMHNGMVSAMFNDYLGQSVVIEHDADPNENGRLLSIYAHTKPLDHIKLGYPVAKGDIIATIADTSLSRAKIPPHLHFTLGHPSANLIYDQFVWNQMRDPNRVVLLNPISALDWPWEVIDSGSKNGVPKQQKIHATKQPITLKQLS